MSDENQTSKSGSTDNSKYTLDEGQLKKVAETAALISNFKKNLTNFPKHLSFEASTLLCVRVGLKQSENIPLKMLPPDDQKVILAELPKGFATEVPVEAILYDPSGLYFNVEMDEHNDFKLAFHGKNTGHVLRFFNSLLHPQGVAPEAKVAIEQKGEQIKVGNVMVDKNELCKKAGVPSKQSDQPSITIGESYSIKATNRNAYEIRADVLKWALDFANNESRAIHSEDMIIDIAKKFYAFVENRR
jgi:hypothetical protein